MPTKIELPNANDLVAEYVAGTSENQLASKLNVSRSVVARLIRDAGVNRRSRSKAEKLKWRSMRGDRTRVQRQLGAAWSKCRGRRHSSSERRQRATTMHARQHRVAQFETEVADIIRAAGFSCSQQTAVDTYNLDISLDELPVAVEVSGHCPAMFRRNHGRQRTKHLLDRGWFVIFIRFKNGGYKTGVKNRLIDLAHVRQHLIPMLQRASRDKSVFGQYGMILGHPQYHPSTGYDLDGLPAVE